MQLKLTLLFAASLLLSAQAAPRQKYDDGTYPDIPSSTSKTPNHQCKLFTAISARSRISPLSLSAHPKKVTSQQLNKEVVAVGADFLGFVKQEKAHCDKDKGCRDKYETKSGWNNILNNVAHAAKQAASSASG